MSAFLDYPKSLAEVRGMGLDNSWMWHDPVAYCDACVEAKVNTIQIDLFGCGPTATHWPDPSDPHDPARGYWMDHFDQVKPVCDKWIDACRRHKILLSVTMCGWGFRMGGPDPDNGGKPSTICSRRFDTEWFRKICRYFAVRGTSGVVLTPAAEPFVKNRECDSKYWQFARLLDANWQGWKWWNAAGNMPTGYSRVHHPRLLSDYGPRYCVVVTDCAVNSYFLADPKHAEISTYKPDAKLLTSYIRGCGARKNGFILYGYRFVADPPDYGILYKLGAA